MFFQIFVYFLIFNNVLGYPPQFFRKDESSSDSESCQISAFTPGECKPVTHCPAALKMIRNSKRHYLDRCGFVDNIEIVCCPKENDSPPTSNRDHDRIVTSKPTKKFTTTSTTPTLPERRTKVGSKSQQACAEYSNEIPLTLTFHILGGTDASIGEFPHMAAIGYEYNDGIKFECGGSLISDRYVLTAAHCILRRDDRRPVVVRLGKVDLQGNSDNAEAQDYPVEIAVTHPEYKSVFHYNDIALIRLRKRVVNTENIHPACLYTQDDIPVRLVATGWGITDLLQGDQSRILQKVNLEPVSLEKCNGSYVIRSDRRLTRGIVDTQMCASGNGERDACTGDSGGPLQVQQPGTANMWSVIGITSFGVACGSSYPGVYSRVSKYIGWIEDIVWDN